MPFRIVAYADNKNSFLADSLARCINARTKEMCRCVRGDETGSGILFDDYREWKRGPGAISEELAAADLIIRCAREIAPQHRALVASKPIVSLAPYRADADTAFLRIKVLRSRGVAKQPPDIVTAVVPFPVPLWEGDYSPTAKGAVPGLSYATHVTSRAPAEANGGPQPAGILDRLQAEFPDQMHVLKNGHPSWHSPHPGRMAHIFVDNFAPGGGGGYSLAALAWGCVVINGFASCPSSRATIRTLTSSGIDPPFLCASPDTIGVLLSCLLRTGPTALVEEGQRNRRWLEQEWDFTRQWSLFWAPIVHKALEGGGGAAGLRSRHELKTCASGRKSVSVVIVTRDEGVYLRRTVHSLHEGLAAGDEIIVVDDQSTDGSADTLAESYEGVRVLRPDQRLGVAGARNYGAKRAGGDVLVFSDAHIEVPRDWAAPLVDSLSAESAGAAGAGLHSLEVRSGKGVCGGRWCAGKDDYLKWQWLPCRNSEPHAVPLLSGGFLALRRELFDAVGGFDDGMWMYGVEDTELSVRLWTLGYECLAVPRLLIAHRFTRPGRTFACDYKSGLGMHIHNKLRLAVLHFKTERIMRVVECFAPCRNFPLAFARLASGDAWVRRGEIQLRRKHDDDWYFKRFDIGS